MNFKVYHSPIRRASPPTLPAPCLRREGSARTGSLHSNGEGALLFPAPHDFVLPVSGEGDLGGGVGAGFCDSRGGDGSGGGPEFAEFGDLNIGSAVVVRDGILVGDADDAGRVSPFSDVSATRTF